MSDKNILEKLVDAIRGTRKSEGNPYHDAQGRFTSGGGAAGNPIITKDFGGKRVALRDYYSPSMSKDAMRQELKKVDAAHTANANKWGALRKKMEPLETADYNEFMDKKKMSAGDRNTFNKMKQQLKVINATSKRLIDKKGELKDRLAGYRST